MPGPVASILLVDDDSEILESMRDLLKLTFPKVRVLTAPSGEAALQLLKNEHPWIIVSDYRMPGMDGVEFLRRSIPAVPDAARLMMSAYADPKVAKEASEKAGVALLVTKPFQLEYFVQVLGSLLERHAA